MADSERLLYLGEQIDAATHERTGDSIRYDPADLTTHGVIVGMTGSGKTGLGIILLEEALLQGIPALVIDPKGDMGNLLLNFPGLTAEEFEPWVDPADADREGISVGELADRTATLWREGLAGWDIGPDRLAALRDLTDLTVYTPGSTAGVPLDLIGDLEAPTADVTDEAVQDEIEGYVTSLLGLVDIDSDPLAGREHILLANLISAAWTQGKGLDLAALLAQVQDPPMRKLGVIELETFFPKSDRTQLALRLNGLLASPSFAGWAQGTPLDIDRLLGGDPTKGSIITISHLSDQERQFVVTTVLSKLVTWMRGQSGTADLRALVYMDEVFGYVPPTAAPPAKKPILTILKQARAFGVGLVLSTQNPVDLDYKAISNAGTWMVGRLQTERDKARLLEGLTSASGDIDVGLLDDTLSGLGKREFLLHSTKASAPVVFTTRWAMSYLAGPLTRDQIAELQPDRTPPEPAADDSPAESTEAASGADALALGDDETAVMPEVAETAPVRYLDPAAPWAGQLGATADGRRLVAALAVRVNLLYDDTPAKLRHEAEWEAVVHPLGESVDTDALIAVDYDDRDLRTEAPDDAVYVLPEAPVANKTYFTGAAKAIRDHLYRQNTLVLFRNTELKLYSRVDEGREAFEQRCLLAADEGADEAAEKIRASLAKKADRIRDAISKAEDRAREIESDTSSRRGEELLSAAGDLLGGFLGGRKSRGGLLGGLRRASSKRRQSDKAAERLESAQNRLDDKIDELEALEAELTETLLDINDLWDQKAAAIETHEVGLEKTDISVDDVVLVWIRTP